MSKYIIDIPDNVKKIVYFHVGNANAVWTTSNVLDDLELLTTDYINEHFGSLQDDAYKRGINDGSLDVKQRVEGAYQKGFEDGKAVNQDCEGCKYAEMGSDTTICAQCCNGYHNQWTAKADKIEVGDEVKHKEYKKRFVVTKMQNGYIYGISEDGSWNNFRNDGGFDKTGRHFDIDKILEGMRYDS